MDVVVIAGDLHCGSTVGLCPPDGLELDDGGHYVCSPAQLWLWERWEKAWSKVKRRTRGKNRFHLILNGDLIDGDHHRTSQIASVLTGIHFRCAMECLEVPLSLKPSSVHVNRGTPSHVGRSGEVEEGIARVLRGEGWPVVKDPDTGQFSSYRRRLDIDGVRFDIAHHGRMGRRAHTTRGYASLYSFDIWAEQMLEAQRAMNSSDNPLEAFNERRPPDIAVRSHNHRYVDSGHDYRGLTRVIAAPAWQLATEYVHRIAAESLADIGLVMIIIKDGKFTVEPLLFMPDRPSLMRA